MRLPRGDAGIARRGHEVELDQSMARRLDSNAKCRMRHATAHVRRRPCWKVANTWCQCLGTFGGAVQDGKITPQELYESLQRTKNLKNDRSAFRVRITPRAACFGITCVQLAVVVVDGQRRPLGRRIAELKRPPLAVPFCGLWVWHDLS